MDSEAMTARMMGALVVSVIVGLVFAAVLFVVEGRADFRLAAVAMFIFFMPWAAYIYAVESGMIG